MKHIRAIKGNQETNKPEKKIIKKKESKVNKIK